LTREFGGEEPDVIQQGQGLAYTEEVKNEMGSYKMLVKILRVGVKRMRSESFCGAQ